MAYTNVPAVTPTSAGITLTPQAAAAAGNSFYNDGRTICIIENGSGGSINATFDTPVTVDNLAVPNPVVAIPAGARKAFRFPTGPYNQPDGATDVGMVHVDYSAVTSVTILILQ